METITWTHAGKVRRARIPAHVQPFVRALGAQKAAELFLKHGGSERYLSSTTRATARATSLLDVLSQDELAQLRRQTNAARSLLKIPVANAFLVMFFKSQGVASEEIARRVRQDVATVRNTLRTLGEEIGDAE